MYEGPKEEFYVEELKVALKGYHEVNEEVSRLSEDRRQKARLVKSLLSVLKLQSGEKKTQDLLDRFQLAELARPFLTLENLASAGITTVVRRRQGNKKAVSPSAVIEKGTEVKMISGTYAGYTGMVASRQAKHGRRGLDVTYFLSLMGPKGDRKRTSVKHGTLDKSWKVAE